MDYRDVIEEAEPSKEKPNRQRNRAAVEEAESPSREKPCRHPRSRAIIEGAVSSSSKPCRHPREAVSPSRGSRAVVEEAEHKNLFVNPKVLFRTNRYCCSSIKCLVKSLWVLLGLRVNIDSLLGYFPCG
jgi:hypothetical protein